MRRVFSEPEARALTNMALAEGLIRTDEPCCHCGTPQVRTRGSAPYVRRHHPDLLHRPLWTIPLCERCHQLVHRGLLADPGLGRERAAHEQVPAGPAPALFVTAPADPSERQRVLLEHFPHGEHRSARDLTRVLGWGLGTVHAVLRELRLAGVVDCPIPSLGFVRIDQRAHAATA
jgi:hypothetical protein